MAYKPLLAIFLKSFDYHLEDVNIFDTETHYLANE